MVHYHKFYWLFYGNALRFNILFATRFGRTKNVLCLFYTFLNYFECHDFEIVLILYNNSKVAFVNRLEFVSVSSIYSVY